MLLKIQIPNNLLSKRDTHKVKFIELKNIFSKYLGTNIVILIIYFFIASFFLSFGVLHSPDSWGYLNMHEVRPPLVPLYFRLISYIFGDKGFEIALLLINCGFWVVSTFYLTMTLIGVFKISYRFAPIVILILTMPFYFHSSINFANSETLSYPLFFIWNAFFIKAFSEKTDKYLLFSIILVMLLILTRAQFLFLIPLYLVAFVYIFIKDKQNNFSKVKIIIAFVIMIIAAMFLKNIHHYFNTDKLNPSSHIGLELTINAMFVASPDDKNLFKDEKERRIFEEAFYLMQKSGFTYYDFSEPEFMPIEHYDYNLRALGIDYPMGNGNLVPLESVKSLIEDKYKLEDKDYLFLDNHPYVKTQMIIYSALKYNEVLDLNEISKITKSMALKLITNNPKDYLYMYYVRITDYWGGVLATCLVFALALMVLIINSLKNDSKTLILLIGFTVTCANIFTVALAEPLLARYTSPTSYSVICILICFILSLFNDKKNKKLSDCKE